MTAPHPLQLHLFDVHPDPSAIPPERRQRLLRLTGELLQEAALSERLLQEATSVTAVIDE
ncbi:MAG: hypothetical protein AB8B85_20580 [Paracoccaceae bacterium]